MTQQQATRPEAVNNQHPTDQVRLRGGMSLRSRIMRRLTPLIILSFLTLGLILAAFAWIASRSALERIHRIGPTQISQQFQTEINNVHNDLLMLANGDAARTFARSTTVFGADSFTAQIGLLREFADVMNQHRGEYLALRYITATGVVWTSSENYTGGLPRTEASISDVFIASDEVTWRDGLSAPLGTVIAGPVDVFMFEPENGGTLAIPLVRLSAPVAPLNDVSTVAGVIQLELALDPLVNLLSTELNTLADQVTGRQLLLTDTQNQILFDTTTERTYSDHLQDGTTLALTDRLPSLSTLIIDDPLAEFNAVPVGGQIVSNVALPFGDTQTGVWHLVLVDDLLAVQGTFILAGGAIVLMMLVIGGVVLMVINGGLRRSFVPLTQASVWAQTQVSGGAAAAPPVVGGEVAALLDAFEGMTQRVERIQQDLDRERGRYDRHLQLARRLNQETGLEADMDAVLQRTIDLICEDFGYFHAQILQLDEVGEHIVLTHSYAGRFLDRPLRVPVHAPASISQVIRAEEPHLQMEVQPGDESARALLPESRTRLILPLKADDELYGVLDIQGLEAGSINSNDVLTFQFFADQIATTLYNVRRLHDLSEQLRVAETQPAQHALTTLRLRAEEPSHYQYNLMGVEPLPPDADPLPGLSASIAIRGQVVGAIEAALPDDTSFSDGDAAILRAVADRVGIAIENVRLIEATQYSLAETSTLYDLSRYLNEADSLEDIVRSIIVSVMPEASGGQIGVFDEYAPGADPTWLEIVADWGTPDRPPVAVHLAGVQLRFGDHPILLDMQADQVVLISDTERDTRIDDVFRAILLDTHSRALVLIPFSVRNVWRGVIFVEFPRYRTFTEREGRIYSALIDQAGVAIDNRMLLQQNAESLVQIERLYSASRITNMSERVEDLVHAAVTIASAENLNFELGLFEGELDSSGWPTRLRIVARSAGVEILTEDETLLMPVVLESPLRQREPEITVDRNPDAPAPTAMIAYLRERGRSFCAAFPLFSANQPIAVLLITAAEIIDLAPEDYEVYRALTGQMSTVLQKNRLLEQTEKTLDETRRLYAASRAIAGALDARAVYEAAVKHLFTPTTPVSRVAVLMAGPVSTPQARYVDYDFLWTGTPAAISDIRENERVVTELVPFAEILETFQGVAVFNNLRRGLNQWPALRAILERSGTQSAVLTTLESRGKWFGALLCESLEGGAFDEQSIRFIRALTDQIAIAVESLQLFDEARDAAQRALALAEAGQLASQIGAEFETSIAEVFARVAEPAEYDRWLLALVDDDQSMLATVVHRSPQFYGEGEAETERYLLAEDESAVIDSFALKRTLLVNDPAVYPAYTDVDAAYLNRIGKQLVTPVYVDDVVVGVVGVGRAANAQDLDASDEQLVETLAAQVGIALENRRLFDAAENERRTLGSILNTLPAGVLVLDAQSQKPIQHNDQAEQLLGRRITPDEPFGAQQYGIFRTGTKDLYPDDEFPVYTALTAGMQASSDDVSILNENDYEVNLLVEAAPIIDHRGLTSAIVMAFQDISTLRSLENTLQQNLRETITLYEATRSLSEAEEVEQVIDQLILFLSLQEPTEAMLVLQDDPEQAPQVARSLRGVTGAFPLPEVLLQAHQPVFIEHIDQAYELDDNERMVLATQGIVAVVSLPMTARSRRDRPLGWIVLTFDEATFFGPERQQFVTTLADSAAITLDNRDLFQRTETALQETAALYRATSAISRAGTADQLTEALKNALSTLTPDVYAGYLADSETDELYEIFNIALDGPPPDLRAVLSEHPWPCSVSMCYFTDLAALVTPAPMQSALLALGNIRGVALVQLRVQNRASGYLILGYHQPHRFDSSQIRYLSAIADSAGVVVDNQALFARIERALEETSTLYKASRGLADVTDDQQILFTFLEHRGPRPLDVGLMAMLTSHTWDHPEATVSIIAAWHNPDTTGLNFEGVTLTPDQFPAWSLLASQTMVVIDDIAEQDDVDELTKLGIMSMDLRSLTILPLRVAGEGIGAILIGSSSPYKHTERDLRVTRAFAEQASLRMEASRLLAQTERRARQLETSSRVSQIASSILDLENLLPAIVDLIRDSFGYDHVQVFLMDNDNNYAELQASTGEPGKQLLAIGHKLQKGSASVIGQVTATGLPTIASDTADARVPHRPNPYLPNTRSEMALPLMLKGNVVGALDVQSNRANAFDSDDVAVLTTLAAQISVAIDNAQLFEQSRRRAGEMSFLFTVTTVAASAETLAEALGQVANALQDALNALAVGIYLPQDYEDNEGQVVAMLHPVALAGSEQPLEELAEIQLDSSQNLLARVARTREPLILDNLDNENRYLPIDMGACSAILVPLTSGQDLIGLVTLEDTDYAAYDEDTLTLLLTLSGTLSAVIDNQRLLERLQETNEQLREVDRLKNDFLANMSHELRTPLNSIIGFSRVILKGIDGPLTEMQEQDLTTIYTSGQHLLGLINDILDQAKLAAGKMDLQFNHFEVKGVIDGVRSIGIGLVKDKPIDIHVEMASGLPKVYGDEFRIRQALLNVVSNAAKFTREGSITLSVYPIMDAELGIQMVRVDVTDTGIGIPEKDLDRIFEAFRQVDSSLTRTQGGTGLGLPITKSLIEMQGGRMEVESTLNVGSTFSILLPTQPVEKAADAGAAPSANGIGKSEEGKTGQLPALEDTQPESKAESITQEMNETPGRRGVVPLKRQLLLIEENPDLVDEYRRLIQREGFEVFTATIPLEAVAMSSGLHPTVIVMDVQFATGEGWNILKTLKQREDTCDIPIVIVSLSADRDEVLQAGAFTYLQRPFMPEDLAQAVRAAEVESRVERILIIDDNEDSIRLLQQLLDDQGRYRIFSAHDGAVGIALVARRRPNLVILDLRMPEMDGFQVINELRNNPETATIPILVVTGDTLNNDELAQLDTLDVIYKSDISNETYKQFVDGVKAHLTSHSDRLH
ncbi:MAG: GAF domain-containing protein [Chloroflexi bacterium]|nr:GAF domain-containing protein [Chloroflexota bacterium]